MDTGQLQELLRIEKSARDMANTLWQQEIQPALDECRTSMDVRRVMGQVSEQLASLRDGQIGDMPMDWHVQFAFALDKVRFSTPCGIEVEGSECGCGFGQCRKGNIF